MAEGKRRSPAQLARDRKRIGELYLRGWLQVDIAGEVGLGTATVCRDLKTLHEDWKQSGLFDYDEAKGKELARIDALELVYWGAWEESRQEKQSTLTERVQRARALDSEKAQVRKEEMLGDPRFLAGVQWCIEKRCKLLGLDAPTKVDVSHRDVDTEIERGLAELAAARQAGDAAPDTGAQADVGVGGAPSPP
jgi:hypothetical protein